MSGKVVFYEYGDPDVLRLVSAPERDAGPGQVRVRVKAAGVNPVDCRIRRGEFAAPDGTDAFPQTLGNEFAGIVDQVGPDVSGFAVGDEVLGFAGAEAYAEHVVVPTDAVTRKPDGVDWEMAGALSAVGQTAWNALRELRVASGETLLVHAAAGGVGTVIVQLATRLGATVIGTASDRNHDYLRSLGAIPVTYGPGLSKRVRDLAPRGVDAALDAVGGDAITVSLDLVDDHTRIGTLVDQSAADRFGIRRLRGARSATILAELVTLCQKGELRLPVTRVYPLKDAKEAHRAMETGHVRGKIALVVE
ncbi:NADP-dependent oxidoreductase [Micromonospora sp. KC213]|uniref:NADP-dependent oxidoreductase n=1 Tax=Micromonospora sp. KC213 TaxID=2530378 RepID=UPI001FB718FE|nr:NADP-dependent oxidoreductase [Micromonospora sp. KC213]